MRSSSLAELIASITVSTAPGTRRRVPTIPPVTRPKPSRTREAGSGSPATAATISATTATAPAPTASAAAGAQSPTPATVGARPTAQRQDFLDAIRPSDIRHVDPGHRTIKARLSPLDIHIAASPKKPERDRTTIVLKLNRLRQRLRDRDITLNRCRVQITIALTHEPQIDRLPRTGLRLEVQRLRRQRRRTLPTTKINRRRELITINDNRGASRTSGQQRHQRQRAEHQRTAKQPQRHERHSDPADGVGSAKPSAGDRYVRNTSVIDRSDGVNPGVTPRPPTHHKPGLSDQLVRADEVGDAACCQSPA